ncbi:MAG: hypothetical protein KDC87_10565 [Planctomycetes bacterium]|nr:hypothetical protein [Planctomycetota bacterium]MCB9868333.1 hypothetical protein [Planctomycetota bacterium]
MPGQAVLDLLDGETLYHHGSLVTLGTELDRGDRLRRGAARLADPSSGHESRWRSSLAYQFGLRHDLQVGFALNTAELHRAAGAVELEGSGLGDLDLLVKWRVARFDAVGRALNLAVIHSLSLPVGRDDAVSSGTRVEPELQPGSGSVDPALGFAVTHEPGRWRFNAATLYRWRLDTDGDGWRKGDELEAELQVGNRFWLEPYPGPFARVDLGVRYERESTSRIGGVRQVASGGERLLWTLDFAFRPRPALDLQLGVDVPMWQRVGGTQYGTDWVVRFAVGYRF